MKIPLLKSETIRRKWENAAAFLGKYYLIILAAGLSVLIQWVIRVQLPTRTQPMTVKITPQIQENEIMLGTPTPDHVTVSVSGSNALLSTLKEDNLEIKLDTGSARRARNSNGEIMCTWNLTPNMVPLPGRISAGTVSPKQVTLMLDTRSTKLLQVKPILNDFELPKGYKVGKITVDPEKVTVTGPSTKLEVIQEIRTLPISLKNITHSFDCDQEFDVEAFADIDFDRKNVLVQVEILRATKTKVIKTLPVRILIPPSSRLQTMSCEIVSAPTVDVEVTGEENMIEGLDKNDIFIFASISEFTKPGLYWIDLRCAIEKNGVTSFKINPQKVNVKLEQISRR